MSGLMRSKINKLLEKWPQNLIATTTWLHSRGISSSLIQRYVGSGWLKRIGTGAYLKVGDHLDWVAAVEAIQSQLKLDIHIGGDTALELHGVIDQVPQSKNKEIYLYGAQGTKLPKWFFSKELKINTIFSKIDLFSEDPTSSFVQTKQSTYSVKISSRERAVFELLSEVPQKRDLESIQPLFIQFATLRSKIIQSHLEKCNSIKVKRLFLYLARESNHSWYKDLDKNKIELGSGNRVIAVNGVLDSEFMITVPASSEVHS